MAQYLSLTANLQIKNKRKMNKRKFTVVEYFKDGSIHNGVSYFQEKRARDSAKIALSNLLVEKVELKVIDYTNQKEFTLSV